jgi:hypothetical protein
MGRRREYTRLGRSMVIVALAATVLAGTPAAEGSSGPSVYSVRLVHHHRAHRWHTSLLLYVQPQRFTAVDSVFARTRGTPRIEAQHVGTAPAAWRVSPRTDAGHPLIRRLRRQLRRRGKAHLGAIVVSHRGRTVRTSFVIRRYNAYTAPQSGQG